MNPSSISNDREHRYSAKRLSAYLDRQLSKSERQRVERHLADCATCQCELDTLAQTVALLHQSPMRPVPRSFALTPDLLGEKNFRRSWSLAFGFLRAATAVVTLALLLLVSGDVLMGMGVLSFGRQSQATAPWSPQNELPAAKRAEDSTPSEQVRIAAAPAVSVSPTAAPLVRAAGPQEATAALPKGAVPPEPQPSMAPAPRALASPPTVPQTFSAPIGAQEPVTGGETAPRVTEAPLVDAAPRDGLGGGEPEANLPSVADIAKLAATAPAEGPAVTALQPVEPPAPERPAATAEAQTLQAPQDVAPLPSADQPAPLSLVDTWQTRQQLRLVMGLLGGLLLMLLGGLLWTGYMRRA